MYICLQSILVGSDISYNFLIQVFALYLTVLWLNGLQLAIQVQ